MWIRRLKGYIASDFAFRQDTTLAYLPVVIAFLTLLSICMTYSSTYIKHVTLNSAETLKQRLHLHIPYHVTDLEMKHLYEELATIADIEMVEEVRRSDMQGFLQSWLSIDGALSDAFPLPKVLDIMLFPEADRAAIKQQIEAYLNQQIEGALLESYDDSIAAFNQSAQLIKSGVYILGFIVLCTITMIVVIISRISLGVHKKHIEILHHLGASDVYINRQFIKRAMMIAMQGVVGGTVLSVLFIEVIKTRFFAALSPTGVAEISTMWIYYFVNPLLIIILVMMASWVSIEAQLRKMH